MAGFPDELAEFERRALDAFDAETSLADRDLQVTLRFQDGNEQTFTVLRDRNMRWHGVGTDAPLVAIEAEWFDNPSQPLETERNGHGS